MTQVCYYIGCGVVYGEKEPISDKNTTHGLCPKHLKISLKEIKAEMEKEEREECHGNHPDRHLSHRAHRRSAHLAPQ